MGHVQRAYDPLLQRNVAIKMLVLDREPTADHIQLMQREAKALARLNHRNVVQILDFDITEENQPFLVMDLIEGQDLDQILEAGPLPLSDALELGLQICAGLKHAHENSLLHRDLKPANVLIQTTDDGEQIAKIIDLGLAKFQTTDQKLTRPGVPVGSPTYMSPEQAKGLALDERSDIYSFGCLLFKMLTGRPPFKAATAIETLHQQISEPAPTLSAVANKELDDELETIVAKCLAKDPEERFKSVGELAKELSALQEAHLQKQEVANLPGDDKAHVEVSTGATKAIRPARLASLAAVAFAVAIIAFVTHRILTPPDDAGSATTPLYDPLELPANTGFEHHPQPGGSWLCKAGMASIKLTDEDLKSLVNRRPRFEELDISDREVNGSGLRYLGTQPVKSLNISRTDLDDLGAKNIATFKRLRILRVTCCNSLTNVGMQTIVSNNPNICYLEFGSQTTTLHTFEIVSSMPNLQYIMIELVDKPLPKGYGKPLGKLKNLMLVAFRNCHFLSGDDLEELVAVKKLNAISLWGQRISKDIVRGLNKLPLLELKIAEANLFEPGALLELKQRDNFTIDLFRLPVIPEEELKALQKKYPHWKIKSASGDLDPSAEL